MKIDFISVPGVPRQDAPIVPIWTNSRRTKKAEKNSQPFL